MGDNSKAYSDLLYRLNIGDDDYRKEEIDNYRPTWNVYVLNVEQYHKNLKPEHIAYFKSRKIEEEFIDAYEWDTILFRPNNHTSGKDGQPIYWCARAFDSSKIERIIQNIKSPQSASVLIVKMSYTDTIHWTEGNDDLWIAEGVFDFASLWQDGESVLCNATGMSNKHIQTVMQVAKILRLILCFDNDSSGTQFTRRMFKSCFEHNIQFTIVTIPTEYRKKKPIKRYRSDAYCAGLKQKAK